MLRSPGRLCTRNRLTLSLRRRYSEVAGQSGDGAQAKRPFDILFLGRDEFSCQVLQKLHAAKDVWQSISLVTQPDVRFGRRYSKVAVSPLKLLGEERELPVHLIPERKRQFRDWQLPDPFLETPPPPSRLLVTASFGRILTNAHLSSFAPDRRLNVHPSLLPMYRGPAPIQHTILDSRRKTGVCVIEMTEAQKGIDAGDIWGKREIQIRSDVAFPALRDTLAQAGGEVLVSVLRKMLNGTASSVPQEPVPDAPRAPFITDADVCIDFTSMTAEEIVRRHRAFGHQKPIYAVLTGLGKKLQLLESRVLYPKNDLMFYIPQPGDGYFWSYTSSLVIHCKNGTVLSVSKVKQESRATLDAREWWNGLRPEMKAVQVKFSPSEPISFMSTAKL